ncbi:hypothetical protein [Pseudarthrobacter sp. fls2-241-R2A-168]|uniref:hypothetical protein n=1 Tax=Pseudarthrobacter sp. fls2-241-R2A-168 TaxID=3040304 RepID=UPI002552C0BB|nr:hypothetical protein [Pseudarthrobacter sp. fls2-241-R2A-168]
MATNPTIFVNVDEEYPAFRMVEELDSYPAAVAIEADPATVERWQKVIDAYEDVRAEIAAKVAAATGTTYPELL